MDWTLEVPVSDVGQAIAFYLDHDTHAGEMQLTPPGFAGPDGNGWVVQQINARADTPLIPRRRRWRNSDLEDHAISGTRR
jgi:hypothetical protein